MFFNITEQILWQLIQNSSNFDYALSQLLQKHDSKHKKYKNQQ